MILFESMSHVIASWLSKQHFLFIHGAGKFNKLMAKSKESKLALSIASFVRENHKEYLAALPK